VALLLIPTTPDWNAPMNALLISAAWAVSTPIVLLVGTLLLALLEHHLPAVTPADNTSISPG
jgi:hypothetical protein